MKLPIRVRMTAWYVALLAIILTAVGAFVVVRLRADLIGTIDHSLRPQTRQIAIGYGAEGPRELHDVSLTVLSGERSASQAVDPAGSVLFSYGDAVARVPMLSRADQAAVLRGGVVTRTVTLGADATRFRVVGRKTLRMGQPQVVVAGSSLAPVTRAVNRVLVLLLFALPAALLVTAGGGWWLARRALRPIERMTTTAAGIGVQPLGQRLAVPRTSDEVAHLARTLNTMLERIQRGVEDQRRLVADASHELRTPLAAMRTELDVSLRTDDPSPAAREVLESAREEVDGMSRTVADLLTLAAADEGGITLTLEPVDLGEVARRVMDGCRGLAARRGIELESLDEGAVLVSADEERLCQVVRNLVENAIKFSPPGARVEIATGRIVAVAKLTVLDEGPGVDPEHRERIFERFFRADASRTRQTGGTGLGLAIAREIVEAHGGHIHVEPRQPAGSSFSIELPALPKVLAPGSAPSASPQPGVPGGTSGAGAPAR